MTVLGATTVRGQNLKDSGSEKSSRRGTLGFTTHRFASRVDGILENQRSEGEMIDLQGQPHQ